ncbi:MAG: hypothetical protein ICV62_08925 [Cyanobacteria bacterium Co-bin13]|nr:hypothetical protein [Cyanobacteria bacterium Co-bin13]
MYRKRGPNGLLSAEEENLESERVKDVKLILDNLFQREETTVKMVLDCLYDIGSVRLINRKISAQSLRGPLKAIARMSKPAFRLFALRRLQRQAPQLITDWLYSQAAKAPRDPAPPEEDITLIDVVPTPAELPPAKLPPLVEIQAAEINSLRGRISRLTILLVAVLLVTGSLIMFS